MAAAVLRSTVRLALRPTAAAPASSRLSSFALANTRRTMHSSGGRRGYSSSPPSEWELMDACFAAPAAAGAGAYGYLWWVVLPERKQSRVKRGEEQEMIRGQIRDGSSAEQTDASNM